MTVKKMFSKYLPLVSTVAMKSETGYKAAAGSKKDLQRLYSSEPQSCTLPIIARTHTHLLPQKSYRNLRQASFLFPVFQLSAVTEQQNEILYHCPCLRPLSSTLNSLPSLCFSPSFHPSLPFSVSPTHA